LALAHVYFLNLDQETVPMIAQRQAAMTLSRLMMVACR